MLARHEKYQISPLVLLIVGYGRKTTQEKCSTDIKMNTYRKTEKMQYRYQNEHLSKDRKKCSTDIKMNAYRKTEKMQYRYQNEHLSKDRKNAVQISK